MDRAAWDWLAGTYWYVPAENLLAYISRPSSQVHPINDQTVFTISESRNGYFWGQAVVQLGDQERTCYFLFGSVSPPGNVQLTFTSSSDSPGQATVTHGSGVMCLLEGEAAMLNQMSSGPAQVQVSHWAYMLQTKEGDPSWSSLPGVDMSVPDFLSPCQSSS